MNKKVVLYNLENDTHRGCALQSILQKLEIPSDYITGNELNQKIGYLAGISGYFKDELLHRGEKPDCEFMLMCGLEEPLLDNFLEEMMAINLRINYKAVVTEHNRDFTVIQLLEDIAREHEMYQSYLTVKNLIKNIEELDPFIYAMDPEWKLVQQGLRTAHMIMRRDNLTKHQLDNLYVSLNKHYKSLIENHKSPQI